MELLFILNRAVDFVSLFEDKDWSSLFHQPVISSSSKRSNGSKRSDWCTSNERESCDTSRRLTREASCSMSRSVDDDVFVSSLSLGIIYNSGCSEEQSIHFRVKGECIHQGVLHWDWDSKKTHPLSTLHRDSWWRFGNSSFVACQRSRLQVV